MKHREERSTSWQRFNRYIVECKYNDDELGFGDFTDLIDT